MSVKIGKSEGSAMVAISMLPIFIYKYLGVGISKTNGAFWINFIISAIVVYFVIKVLQKGLRFQHNCKSKFAAAIFNSLFLIYIFSFSAYTIYLGTDITEYIFPDTNSERTVLYFSLVASCLSSMCGIEALSRTAYVIFHVVCSIIIIMCGISFHGWTLMNFAPVLGNDVKGTFFPCLDSFVPFLGLVSTSFMVDYYKDASAACLFCKKSFFVFSAMSLAVTLLCILCTPYPMGEYYTFSLSSIFSLADSGVFFHSFEIFLLIFVVIVNILSFSFGIYISAECICKLFSLRDNRPFIMILSLILFCTSSLFNMKEYLLFSYIITSVVLIAFLIIFPFFFKIRRNNEIH